MGFTISLTTLIFSNSVGSESLQKVAGVDKQLNYSFIEKWGSFGTGLGQFNRLHDVSFDSRGNVYVRYRNNNRI